MHLDIEEIEETLTLIPSVISARVLCNDVEFLEIHILSDSDRHPKQIAHDVESCLAAKYGIHLDQRRISVAQVDPPAYEQRLSIDSIQVKLKDRIFEAEVILKLGSEYFVGQAHGPFSSRHRLLLPSQATAQAICRCLGENVHVIIEDVGRFEVAGSPAVVTIATLTTDRDEETLVGAAYVKRDELEATVRSTLASLNRRISIMYSSQTGSRVRLA